MCSIDLIDAPIDAPIQLISDGLKFQETNPKLENIYLISAWCLFSQGKETLEEAIWPAFWNVSAFLWFSKIPQQIQYFCIYYQSNPHVFHWVYSKKYKQD